MTVNIYVIVLLIELVIFCLSTWQYKKRKEKEVRVIYADLIHKHAIELGDVYLKGKKDGWNAALNQIDKGE